MIKTLGDKKKGKQQFLIRFNFDDGTELDFQEYTTERQLDNAIKNYSKLFLEEPKTCSVIKL
jgi:hypothetical protein